MKKKIKILYERHKQKIVVIMMVLVVVILSIGTIIRGVHTLKADTTADTTQKNDISFSLGVRDTLATTHQRCADDKMYSERIANTQCAKPTKEVDISFGKVFTDKPATPTPTTISAPHDAIGTRSERVQIQQELDAIYSGQTTASPSISVDESVINNRSASKEVNRPLTQEELLAQKKKLMEQGFDGQTTTISDASTISIASPTEIPAYIHGSQTIKNNNRIVLRLDAPVLLSNGQTIARNTIIYGKIIIERDRALVSVASIKHGAAIYALPLTGFSEDGMPGLPILLEQNKKIVGDASSSATATLVDRKISNVTGGLVGSVVRDISSATRTRKESYVAFIDNQKIFLRPTIKN